MRSKSIKEEVQQSLPRRPELGMKKGLLFYNSDDPSRFNGLSFSMRVLVSKQRLVEIETKSNLDHTSIYDWLF